MVSQTIVISSKMEVSESLNLQTFEALPFNYILGIQPSFDGGDFVFADDDFLVGGGGHVDAHLAEEIGGELADGSGTDDELTVSFRWQSYNFILI